jgi:large subunit ribosomal protein L19
MNLIDTLERELGKKDLPTLHPGDTVDVHYLIREGEKERVQIYSGTIISISGRGIRRTICVRRIVQGEGVERIFPLHNPRVQEVNITRRGNVRRAKLFYLRDRVGKKTRVKELVGDKVRRERDAEKSRRAAAKAAAEAAAEAAHSSSDEGAAEEAVSAT